MAVEIEMKRAKSKSESPPLRAGLESESNNNAVRAATLEDIVRLTGKDPLVAFAEVACGRLECTRCNGAGEIQRSGARDTCPRCHGSKREKVSATAMLAARYKLATFFYAPRKAVEASGAPSQPPERFLTVRFIGRDGEKAEPA
jgi:hypothetical protein